MRKLTDCQTEPQARPILSPSRCKLGFLSLCQSLSSMSPNLYFVVLAGGWGCYWFAGDSLQGTFCSFRPADSKMSSGRKTDLYNANAASRGKFICGGSKPGTLNQVSCQKANWTVRLIQTYVYGLTWKVSHVWFWTRADGQHQVALFWVNMNGKPYKFLLLQIARFLLSKTQDMNRIEVEWYFLGRRLRNYEVNHVSILEIFIQCTV